ncbi:hypothetical protein BDZ89DRAFT_1079150 [Hymenopellis radicata]|nr:hypothetical protein BDZ89DRAFT_1079150 [Hymenopellis radicata]
MTASTSTDALAAVGYTFSTETRESRHDRRISTELPPYMEYEASPPPKYTLKDEPVTLAMYLFKFGFLFPPFWILGIFILFSPLRAPDATGAWLPDKTDAEKQVVIDRIRTAEIKWARRCLVALLVVTLFGIVAGVSIWAALRGYL